MVGGWGGEWDWVGGGEGRCRGSGERGVGRGGG